jgi:hypothetical protein
MNSPKHLLYVGIFALGCAASSTQADIPPLLHEKPLPRVASPSFKEPLDSSWSVSKGTWTAEEGLLRFTEIPEEKHVPVLHHKVGLSSAVIELDFKQAQPGAFYVGCDSEKHIGRVVVLGSQVIIAEDSQKPSHTIATLPYAAKAGEWHHLRVEWKGDQMAAVIDGQELRAQHPFLATTKVRSWLAGSKTAEIKNLTIHGESAPTTQP